MAKLNLSIVLELDTANEKDVLALSALSTALERLSGSEVNTTAKPEKQPKEKAPKEKPIQEDKPTKEKVVVPDPEPEPEPVVEEDTFEEPAPELTVSDIRALCKSKSEEGLRAEVNLVIKKFAPNLDKVDAKDYEKLFAALNALKK